MGRHDERQRIEQDARDKAKRTTGGGLPARGKGVRDVTVNDKANDLTDILGRDRPRGWTGKHRGRG